MARREDDDDDRPRRRRPRYDEEEDQDERPRARRKSSRDQDEEDYEDPPRRRRRRKAKETNVVGTIALVIAVGALVVALFMPCLASFSLIPAGIGIIVGFIALVLAQKSDGRQGTGLPITALSISAAAILIAVGWLFIGKKVEKKFEEIGAQAEAEAAKEEAKRKKERAKAATEVQTAGASGALRVSAVQFARAYEQDEDRADAMYRNKVIEVTGTVKELDLVNSDEAYIVELIGGPDEFDTVDCEFAKNPATRAELIKLKPGDTVIIRGKCLGGSPTLEACVLVH
jgi:tRNA_anti-like